MCQPASGASVSGAKRIRQELDRLGAGRNDNPDGYISVLDLGKVLRLSKSSERPRLTVWEGAADAALALLASLPDGAGVEAVFHVFGLS